jgi:hypothetical protein
LVAQHAQRFHFRALAATAAVLEHFHIARTCHAVFVDGAFFFSARTPQHKEFANVLDGCGTELVGQSHKHGFTSLTVVAQNANFDQTVGIQCHVGFFDHGRR